MKLLNQSSNSINVIAILLFLFAIKTTYIACEQYFEEYYAEDEPTCR